MKNRATKIQRDRMSTVRARLGNKMELDAAAAEINDLRERLDNQIKCNADLGKQLDYHRDITKDVQDQIKEYSSTSLGAIADNDARSNSDTINYPSHYREHPSGIECITIVRHENFNCGNAIKYIWRRNLKETPVRNLQKAIYYLKNEIARLEGK